MGVEGGARLTDSDPAWPVTSELSTLPGRRVCQTGEEESQSVTVRELRLTSCLYYEVEVTCCWGEEVREWDSDIKT